MFSNEGRALDQETLEYAWLVEILLGKLSGRLAAPHIENIVTSCETFLLLVLDIENSLRSPHSFLQCHHGNNQFECHIESIGGLYEEEPITAGATPTSPSVNDPSDHQLLRVCPTAEEIKYKMVRLSVDAIDVYLVEAGTALSLWVSENKIRHVFDTRNRRVISSMKYLQISPIRGALCNLHGSVMKEGFTLLIPNVQLRHFVMVNPSFTKRFQFSDLNIMQSSSETMTARFV